MTREEFHQLPRMDEHDLKHAFMCIEARRMRLNGEALKIADQLAECVEDRDLIREHIATRKREHQLLML